MQLKYRIQGSLLLLCIVSSWTLQNYNQTNQYITTLQLFKLNIKHWLVSTCSLAVLCLGHMSNNISGKCIKFHLF